MRYFKPPHSASRVLTAAGLLLSTPILAMACSAVPLPDNEPIAEARLAVVPGQNNPPCGASACPTGQVRTCGDVCVTPVGWAIPALKTTARPTASAIPTSARAACPLARRSSNAPYRPLAKRSSPTATRRRTSVPRISFARTSAAAFPTPASPPSVRLASPKATPATRTGTTPMCRDRRRAQASVALACRARPA